MSDRELIGRCFLAGFAIVFTACAIATAEAAEPDAQDIPDAQRIAVQRDAETSTSRVIIRARDGQIAWADLMAGLAKAKGFDDDALADVPRQKAFDLNRRHTRLLLGLMNAFAESSGIRFAILPPPEGEVEPSLEVMLDRRAMLASKRRFEKMLRSLVADRHPEQQSPDYGISFPPQKALGNDRVVVLHGLGSTPEEHASLTADLRQAGLSVGQFAYAGDEPLEDSAKLLSRELKRLRQEAPEVRVRLVALSMGGLVARRVVEDDALDPHNISQLVLVAPPNEGSVLAYCGFALQIWQFLDDAKARTLAERFYNTVEDGLSEASDDLRPDSPFLKSLGERRRNAGVKYALFLGTGAPLSEHAIEELRDHLAAARQRHRILRFLGPKIDRILDDPDELIHGKGDGVVAVKRGRLDGVVDTTTLDFNHLSIGQAPQTDGEQRLRDEIINRLRMPVD